MTPLEAADVIRLKIRDDRDLAAASVRVVKGAGCRDIFEWCEKHPEMASALAEQLLDIDGQIFNMEYLLSQGDLS